jgi:hypothetical protein
MLTPDIYRGMIAKIYSNSRKKARIAEQMSEHQGKFTHPLTFFFAVSA